MIVRLRRVAKTAAYARVGKPRLSRENGGDDMKKMTTLALMLVAAGLILAVCTTAEAAKKASVAKTSGPACLEACRARLKQNGTWFTLPRGTCRSECRM